MSADKNTELDTDGLREDIAAINEIGNILSNFYPDVRIAILEYCLVVANKDVEA